MNYKRSAQNIFSDIHPLVEEGDTQTTLDQEGIAATETVESPADPMFTDTPGEETPVIPSQKFRWPTHFPDDTPQAYADKQYYLGNMTWTTTTNTIFRIRPVQGLLYHISQRAPCSQYKSYTYDNIVFSITLKGGQYYKGRLGISYIGRPHGGDAESNIFGLSQYPTVHIDPTLDTEKTMKCSRVSPQPKEDTVANGPMLSIYPIIPLGSDAIATPSSLVIEIYAHFEGFKYLNHVQSGGLSVSSSYTTTTPLITYLPNTFQGPGQEAVRKAKQGVVSKTLESVSGIAGSLSVLPVVGQAAGVISTIAGIGSAVASAFGFSRPAIISSPELSVVRQLPYANAFGGISTAEALSCEIESTLSTDPKLVGDLDDHTDIYKIAATPSLIRVDRISTIHTLHQKVLEFGVTPCTSAGIDSPTKNTCQPSNIGFVSSLFKLWTGDLKYTFDFASTNNQAVKLAIVWTPNSCSAWSASLRQQQVTVQGSLKVAFDVPWEHINASQLCGFSRGRNNPVTSMDYSNGLVSIWILQPITSGLTGIPTDIYFTVYQSAGESFHLIGPRGLGTGVSLQNTMGVSSLTVPKGIYSEENVRSLRELLKKFAFSRQVQISGSTSPIDVSFNTLNLPTFHLYILKKFTFYRGDLALRMYNGTTIVFQPAVYATDGDNLDGYRVYMDPAKHSQHELTLRFLARSGYRSTHSADGSHGMKLVCYAPEDPTAYSYWECYAAFDDSVSVGVIKCSPVLSFPDTFMASSSSISTATHPSLPTQKPEKEKTDPKNQTTSEPNSEDMKNLSLKGVF